MYGNSPSSTSMTTTRLYVDTVWRMHRRSFDGTQCMEFETEKPQIGVERAMCGDSRCHGSQPPWWRSGRAGCSDGAPSGRFPGCRPGAVSMRYTNPMNW